MSLCRYDTSKPCNNHGTSSRTCLDCVLDKIRAEIEEVQGSAFITHEEYEGLRAALKIIDKYTEESEV